jgi:hypothetical protein
MTDTRKPVESLLTDYDIFEPSFVANPYPGYSEIRESECPIAHTDRYQGSWLPTRYEDVVALAQEYEVFTSRGILVMPPPPGQAEGAYGGVAAPPITSDPPDHHWHRRLILPVFAPQAVAKYEQSTRDLCNALIDEFIDKGTADAAADYAQHIPVRVISNMLGVPLDMEEQFTGWVRGVLENMHDTPYLRGHVGPEIVAAIAIIALWGTVTYGLLGNVNWGLAALVGIPALLGVVVGVRVRARISAVLISRVFAVVLVASAVLLVVNPSHPAKTAKDFVQWSKTTKDPINFGSAGIGSGGHLAGELYNLMAGIKSQHIPYKGTGPAAVGLITGEYHYNFMGLAGAFTHVRSGKLRGIAVSNAKRLANAPEIPAMNEVLPGFEVVGWYGVAAPAKLPKPILTKIHGDIAAYVKSAEFAKIADSNGSEPVTNSPEVFRQFMLDDMKKWADVVKRSGAKF